MPSSKSKSSSTKLSNIEVVRFIFPTTPELALYALATLQSFVTQYDKTVERVNLWKMLPETQTELAIELHCDQRFYLTFKDSFPACVKFIMPGPMSKLIEVDELCVVLAESRLDQFQLAPSYSIQWLMGQLTGTLPRIVPALTVDEQDMGRERWIVDTRLGEQVAVPGKPIYIDFEKLDTDTAFSVAKNAAGIVGRQGVLTVLGVALDKPVVEVTATASLRALGVAPYYVQVSQLNLGVYFQQSLNRGITWLIKKITLPSIAPIAVESSVSSPPPSV